jgi:hypothetical protein
MLRVGKYRLYTITPTILVGPSGIGKGEALGLARSVLKHIKKTLVESDSGPTVGPGMWILEDEATPQALVRAFTIKPSGASMEENDPAEIAIIAGEMATFMGRTGEKEGMVPVITKLLEQDDSYCRTLVKDISAGKNQYIEDPTLSFLAGTTVEWMRKLMPSEMFAGGFFRRCIMVQEEHKGRHLDWPKALPEGTLESLASSWNLALFGGKDPVFPRNTHTIAGKEKVARFDITKSMDYWISWRARHASKRPNDPKLIGHYHSLPQHILRTAICFAAARGRLDILPDDLREAEDFVDSLLDDVYQVLLQGEVHGFEEMVQLLERMLHIHGRVSKIEVQRILRCPLRQFDELIEWGKKAKLIRIGETRVHEGETGVWYELVDKRRTPWGKRRKSNG